METLIVLLFSLAIVLLIISFFGKDKVAKLEEDLEQMTLTYMQDIYQLKKKVKILEEERYPGRPCSLCKGSINCHFQ
ncbi:hypothetical protein [Peribacillus frigoritolerans]|uniref:hypothetical protein n=1 Tax=Peribacillus frigoritolerans TaxID=450367 RepID=UPI0025A0EC7D|nr:hypothetical protein [Peribacillus frigoritolerans]MDM5313345.1 hypothetical protein [Peribacillus frigoritolerans]